MPIQVESIRPQGINAPATQRPSAIALRQSVLNFFGNQICSTDQGQTIYNDTNTFMINNLRLEVENDLGWLWSESQDLDYALDRNSMLPAQGDTSYAKLAGPSYAAFQGVEAGALNGAPLTNDLDEFGNNTLGTLLFNVTVASVLTGTGTQPTLTFGQAQWNGNSATTVTAGNFIVTFSDGRIGYIPFSGSTGFAAVSGLLTWTVGTGTNVLVGGISITNWLITTEAAAASASVITVQAIGTTNVLNQPGVSEAITLPLTFTSSVTGGTYVLTGFGNATTAATTGGVALPALVYGQIAGRNPNFNRGFLDRVTVFQNDATYTNVAANGTTPNGQSAGSAGADVWNYIARIPLKLLHDCKPTHHNSYPCNLSLPSRAASSAEDHY